MIIRFAYRWTYETGLITIPLFCKLVDFFLFDGKYSLRFDLCIIKSLWTKKNIFFCFWFIFLLIQNVLKHWYQYRSNFIKLNLFEALQTTFSGDYELFGIGMLMVWFRWFFLVFCKVKVSVCWFLKKNLWSSLCRAKTCCYGYQFRIINLDWSWMTQIIKNVQRFEYPHQFSQLYWLITFEVAI